MNITEKLLFENINRLLANETPNGEINEDYGEYNEIYRMVHEAFGEAGADGAKGALSSILRGEESLQKRFPDWWKWVSSNESRNIRPVQKMTPYSGIPELPAGTLVPENEIACRWLEEYIAFSKRWTPRSHDGFHEDCGMWLLSTISAGRTVLHFGDKKLASLYIALVAYSSIWAKTSAAKIAKQVIRNAELSFLLADDESTPQSFVRSMATKIPDDYGQMSEQQQDETKLRLAFAAQRGWSYDEFGQKINAMMQRHGHMADYRGLLRRIDDHDESYSSSTISRGTDHLEKPYLALLASMTPADLRPFAGRGAELWGDGFFARFAFSTPGPDEQRSKARFPDGQRIIPDTLIMPLKKWHDRLGTRSVDIVEISDDDEKNGKKKKYELALGDHPEETCTFGLGVPDAYYRYHDALIDLCDAHHNKDLIGNYTRFAEKALRIAMLFASLENDGHIELRHLARAQRITERWRQSLHYLIDQLSGDAESRFKK